MADSADFKVHAYRGEELVVTDQFGKHYDLAVEKFARLVGTMAYNQVTLFNGESVVGQYTLPES